MFDILVSVWLASQPLSAPKTWIDRSEGSGFATRKECNTQAIKVLKKTRIGFHDMASVRCVPSS